MVMKLFYNIPTQVMFFEGDEYVAGIAYKDEIICGCCGGIFEIAEIVALAEEEAQQTPIYEFEGWVDITNEIQGDVEIEDLMERE